MFAGFATVRPSFKVVLAKTQFEARSAHNKMQSNFSPLHSTGVTEKIPKQTLAQKRLITGFMQKGFPWKQLGESLIGTLDTPCESNAPFL